MSLPLFIQGLGSIAIFSSRAFLPAFATALLLRFGPQISWLSHTGLLQHVRGVPTWFTSDTSLIILGVLAVLELVAERVPEVKTFLDEIHDYLKTGMAALTFLGVVGASDRAVVQGVAGEAGFGDSVPAIVVGVGTFLSTRARGWIAKPLQEADEDDDLGLQVILRWVEDLWSGLGAVALILLPLMAIAVFVLALILLVLAGWYVRAREEATRVPCTNCGQLIYACATACSHCKAPNKEPRAVGLLGGTKNVPGDPVTQSYRLVAVKRCPVCATRLRKQAIRQACDACGSTALDDGRFLRDYISFVDRRVPLVCVACFLLGLIPVLGVIPAVILSRLQIVAPFRRYTPAGRNFVLRWGVRIVSLILVAFQWIPLLGGLLLPVMALINYAAYRSAFRKLAHFPSASMPPS
jgi:hypothetical protein